MIVEEQGIDFRTGVRFPSAPLLRKPGKYWKIQCLCGFFVLLVCTKRKLKRRKMCLFSVQVSHEKGAIPVPRFGLGHCSFFVLQLQDYPLHWAFPGLVETFPTIPHQNTSIDPGIFWKSVTYNVTGKRKSYSQNLFQLKWSWWKGKWISSFSAIEINYLCTVTMVHIKMVTVQPWG